MDGGAGLSAVRRSFLKAVGASVVLAGSISRSAVGKANGVFVEESESVIRLGNDQIAASIRRDNGGIEQVRAVEDETTLRRPGDVPALHWLVLFEQPDGQHERLRTATWIVDAPEITISRNETTARVELLHDRPQLKSLSGDVVGPFDGAVVASVEVEAGQPAVAFDLRVENNSNLAVRRLISPTVSNIPPLTDDGSGSILIPRGVGLRFPNPVRAGVDIGLDYPGDKSSMQFSAYTGAPTGFYMGALDDAGNAKSFSWDSQGGVPSDVDRLQFRMRYDHPRQPGASVERPYQTTIEVLRGDWHDAVERYRSWLDEGGWLPDTPPEKPDQLQNRGAAAHAISYYRGESGTGNPTFDFETTQEMVETLRQRLRTPMQFRWRGWSTHGTPAGGDFFPPAEGMEAFENVIDGLAQHNIGTTGYLNITVGLQTSDWWERNTKQARKAAVRRSDGTLEKHQNGITWVLMDAIQDGWQAVYRPALRRLVETGTTGLHLDGFPIQASPDCYADHHAHPPGRGGDWFSQVMRSDLAALYRELRAIDDGVTLSGEGIVDFYLPYMGIHLTKDVRHAREKSAVRRGAELVPMFPYAFDDFVETQAWFGVPPWSRMRDHLRLAIGRCVAWGAVPDLRLLAPPDAPQTDEEIMTYFGRVARARARYANRFLAGGQMLRTPVFDIRSVSVTVEAEDGNTVTENSAAIRASAWQSPRDEVGLLLTNVVADSTETTEVRFPDQPFAIPVAPRVVFMVTNGTYELVEGLDETSESVQVALGSMDVALLVVASGDESLERALKTLSEAQRVVENETESSQLLSAAKRSFEAGNIDGAIESAQEAIRLATETSTPTVDGTPTQESPTNQNESSPATQVTTETGASGFTVLTGVIGGAAGIIASWLYNTEDE